MAECHFGASMADLYWIFVIRLASQCLPIICSFYDAKPNQGMALRTHPWRVNPGYMTPPARTMAMYAVTKRAGGSSLCGLLGPTLLV